MRVRLTPEQRKTVIMRAALKIVRSEGLASVTRRHVSEKCEVQTSTEIIRHYYPHKEDLWRAVIDADITGKARKEARRLGFK